MFSMCSELAPRAHVPDNRIPQLMQPCSETGSRQFKRSVHRIFCSTKCNCKMSISRKPLLWHFSSMKDLANGRKLSFEKEKGTAAYSPASWSLSTDFPALNFNWDPVKKWERNSMRTKKIFIGNITFVLVFAFNSHTHVNLVFLGK